ncbi:hypothetical protein [Cryobacterium sp. Y62]|uniref:hypothetical protein n=1 Tax=Cryobacterium sp. Y62 TaxID=2048284 RepID=UPI0011AFFC52|nr:hypothetical protein [Cryobacterium sp. Y62]
MAKSNLGAYQTMVELAKSADGPVKLGLYVVAGGVLVGGTAVAIVGPAVKKGAGLAFDVAKQKFALSKSVTSTVFTISADADGGKGLWLHIGDTFTVTNEIEGGALIEIRGKKKNPWMVSSHVLENVSDFRIGDSEL